MAMSLEKLIKALTFKNIDSRDKLGAYPENMHVEALPERRYLKTSRILAIFAFISIIANFAMGFIYIRMARLQNATIFNPTGPALYQIDYVNQKISSVESPAKALNAQILIGEKLIREFINLKYDTAMPLNNVMTNFSETGDISLYFANKNDFDQLRNNTIYTRESGEMTNVYIYSVKYLGNTLFEAIFDVFYFNEQTNPYGCVCFMEKVECLPCLRKTASRIQRIHGFYSASILNFTPESVRTHRNPFNFKILNSTEYTVPIYKNNRWMDPNNQS